jgi:hypothetical protein
LDFADPNSSYIDKDGIGHSAVGMDPEHANASEIAALETHAFLPCGCRHLACRLRLQ